MKQWKKGFAAASAVALSLSLASCGSDGDIAGEDWRTTGIVIDEGTITHDGESVYVLVTADTKSAAFYRNLPEQVLYDSVLFPTKEDDIRAGLTDDDENLYSVSFDDLNGDGESDVTVEVYHGDMSRTRMVWIWDAVQRYVYQPDYSYYGEPDVAMEPDWDNGIAQYVGLWEYVGENLWLYIHEDTTWELVNAQDDVIASGTAVVYNGGIELYDDGGGDTLYLDLSVSGDLLDGANGGTLVPTEAID